MNNLAAIDTRKQSHQLPDAKCGCKVDLPTSGVAKQLMQHWLADHVMHIRKDHLLAKEFCEWVARNLNGSIHDE